MTLLAQEHHDSQLQTDPSLQVIDQDLGITLKEFPGGRRIFEMGVGSLGTIRVLDSPATALTESEWEIILRARDSYRIMWGGDSTIDNIKQDPFDGRPPYHTQYLTRHQLAEAYVPDYGYIILTNRKVTHNPYYTPMMSDLFDDIRFWKVHDNSNGTDFPLWNIYLNYFEKQAKEFPKSAHQRAAAISRTGRIWELAGTSTQVARDLAATAWAMMQVAVTYQDDHDIIVCQLCDEFQQVVLAVEDADGKKTMLDFTRTQDKLGLDSQFKLVLDRDNPYLQEHILTFPGYWTNNDDLRTLLFNLAAQGKLTFSDYQAACRNLLNSSDFRSLKIDEQPVIARVTEGSIDPDNFLPLLGILTKPRNCKYLIPLINTQGKINDDLDGDQFRQYILQEVGDGPFSSTLIPKDWETSAKNLLQVAKNKYPGNNGLLKSDRPNFGFAW